MPQQHNTTIHGVEVTQTQLQGKWYTPVDARVKIAEQADPTKVRRDGAGYHVVSVDFVQIGDRWAYHCLVEYPVGSGVVKPGTDFIDLKDVAGVAKAETSAIGRALGLHGIAIEESIASADEMSRVEPAAPADDGGTNPPATDQQAIAIKRLCEQLERSVPLYKNTFTEASRLIHDLSADLAKQRAASPDALRETFPAGQRGA